MYVSYRNCPKCGNQIIHNSERNKHLIPGYDESKRGKSGVPGAYQIDHIKSIVACWYDNDSVEFASDISNLRFISWEENLRNRKWKKSIFK